MMGFEVKDRITGLTGVVTGITTYISGCSQALVNPRIVENGKMAESVWIDVQRLELLSGTAVVVLDNGVTPGFDAPAPIR